MAERERVVITGSGAICGLGRDAASIFSALRAGRSAIAPVRQWDAAAWPYRYAAEVSDLQLADLVADRKTLKLIRRTHALGLFAASQAVDAAGLIEARAGLDSDAAAFNDRSGIYVGSCGAAFRDQYDFLPLLARADGDLLHFGEELPHTVAPMWLLQVLPNNVLCHLGIQTGFSGPHACFVNHSTGGVLAVAEAAAALREGTIDRAVAVAHEAPIEPQTLHGFAALGVLARETLRPFDRRRDGCLLGEGAAALALETARSATARGAAIVGEVLGSALVSEGGSFLGLRADGEGPARAIALALADAAIAPRAVGLIVAHGNGTRASDASEAAALHAVFGAAPPPVTSFKWATGHLLAAAGLLDAVLALEALRAGEVPGIATLQELDPACAPLPVSAAPQTPRGDVALVLSRGFAGTNAALLLRAVRG